MKTIQDYLADPRLLNDPAMAGALDPVKEIHAIRLMLLDETTGMNAIEKTSVDVLANYKSRFEWRSTQMTIERRIANEGIVLYERK